MLSVKTKSVCFTLSLVVLLTFVSCSSEKDNDSVIKTYSEEAVEGTD